MALPAGEALIEFGDRRSQSCLGRGHVERMSHDPYAVLVVVQTCPKVGHKNIQKVLAGVIELATMGAPRHCSEGIDPGIPQRGRGVLHPCVRRIHSRLHRRMECDAAPTEGYGRKQRFHAICRREAGSFSICASKPPNAMVVTC